MDTEKLHEIMSHMDSLFSDNNGGDVRGWSVFVDLEKGTAVRFPIPENIMKSYVSGPALGARLWAEYAGQSVCDASEHERDNPVVLTAGRFSLSGLPYTDTLTITFRSPQNGLVEHHNISNSFARRMMSLKMNAVIITGRSSHICTVELGSTAVMKNPIHSAAQYQDLGVLETERLCRIPDSDVIVVGKSAMNGILHSCAVSKGRSTGRGGLGYVLGCKGIKAIRICGALDDSQVCESEVAEALKTARRNSVSENNMRNGQSLCFARRANRTGSVPVNNYTDRSDPRVFHLFGEEVSRRYGSALEMPSMEEAFMLGPNCGCFSMDSIRARWKHCIDLGMDAVSTGNILGSWRVSVKADSVFCDNNRVFELMDCMAQDPGLAVYQSKCYRINGLECGGIDYRGSFASALNAAMGNLFPVWFEAASDMCKKDYEFWCAFNEDLVLAYETFGICGEAVPFSFLDCQYDFKKTIVTHFPRLSDKIFKGPLYLEAISELSGYYVSFARFLEKGRMCGRLIYEINMVCGSPSPSLPNHFCTDPGNGTCSGSVVNLASLIIGYSTIRDYTMALQG